MKKEKQIEEMANDINKHCVDLSYTECGAINCTSCLANALYNAGSRKVEQGEWKKQKDGTHYCSNCGHDATQNYDYGEICGVACAFCGAHMKGE